MYKIRYDEFSKSTEALAIDYEPATTNSDWLIEHNGVLSRFRLLSINNGNFGAPRYCGQLLDRVDKKKETRCNKLFEPIRLDDFENLPPRRVTIRLQGFQTRRENTKYK